VKARSRVARSAPVSARWPAIRLRALRSVRAAGGVVGSQIHKDHSGCYYYDRDGRRHRTGC
jgi:hypothetical protein